MDNIFQVLFTKDKICSDARKHKTTVTSVVDEKGNTKPEHVLVEFTEPIELSSIV